MAQTKHGATKRSEPRAVEYETWQRMKARCHNATNPDYKDYGARGITVCERWRDNFEAFLDDMGERPSSKHSIDRIDVNGNYEPSNCRWATPKEQARNNRRNHAITIGGVTRTLAEWSEISGINNSTIRLRVKRGWTEERLIQPVA